MPLFEKNVPVIVESIGENGFATLIMGFATSRSPWVAAHVGMVDFVRRQFKCAIARREGQGH
ncbi:hypothetical protein [Streptomyces sp. NBC_01334]|uniref:hypothetical protein n=1 Tax=Streptomyces sp. NBC_01334 TaxID=2903827 RepID=UPI002E12E125|nr:hypothetical protein OG736_43670 [Streptomyces sp. NBC_01334]